MGLKSLKDNFLVTPLSYFFIFFFFLIFAYSSQFQFVKSLDEKLLFFPLSNSWEFSLKHLSSHFTHIFTHFDIAQLCCSIVLLLLLGRYEEEAGSLRFLCVFFISALIASLSLYLFKEDLVMTGSTAALLGVWGASVSELYRPQRKTYLSHALLFIALNLCFAISRGSWKGIMSGYDIPFRVHSIAFLTGILMGLYFKKRSQKLASK